MMKSALVVFLEGVIVDLLSVHARKRASTNGTVIRYMPHFVHLYSGVLGRKDMVSKPTKGGMHAAAMIHILRLGTLRV